MCTPPKKKAGEIKEIREVRLVRGRRGNKGRVRSGEQSRIGHTGIRYKEEGWVL